MSGWFFGAVCSLIGLHYNATRFAVNRSIRWFFLSVAERPNSEYRIRCPESLITDYIYIAYNRPKIVAGPPVPGWLADWQTCFVGVLVVE